MLVHQGHRLQDIAEVLTHLPTVFVEDVSEAEDASIGGLIEDESANRHQGVEPTSGLIDCLTDEVGWIRGVEDLLRTLTMRISPLSERHRA